jgi:hypothetical protein
MVYGRGNRLSCSSASSTSKISLTCEVVYLDISFSQRSYGQPSCECSADGVRANRKNLTYRNTQCLQTILLSPFSRVFPEAGLWAQCIHVCSAHLDVAVSAPSAARLKSGNIVSNLHGQPINISICQTSEHCSPVTNLSLFLVADGTAQLYSP